MLHRQHDRRKILALVGIALIEHRRRAEFGQRVRQRLAPRGAERVGGMDDCPLLLAERVDAEVGDNAAGIIVVRAEAEQPLVAHMGQVRIGAADHHRLAEFEHIGRHRHHLCRANRTEECDDVRLRGQLRKRQHDARIGGLVILDNEFDLLAKHAAGLVDRRERKLGAILTFSSL